MSEPAIVMKWCDTEGQYMAQFEDAATATKHLKSKKYVQGDDGVFWEMRDESAYSTKEMTPVKKTATRKAEKK